MRRSLAIYVLFHGKFVCIILFSLIYDVIVKLALFTLARMTSRRLVALHEIMFIFVSRLRLRISTLCHHIVMRE